MSPSGTTTNIDVPETREAPTMPDTRISSLSLPFRERLAYVFMELADRGYPIKIIQTSRTEAEHTANLASGASSVSRSKHLPRRLRGFPVSDPDIDRADAIDLCPWSVYTMDPGGDKLSWDTSTLLARAAWAAIGAAGERYGLRWGGRWVQPYDPGHLELLLPGERYKDIPIDHPMFRAHGIPTGGGHHA